MYANTLSKFKSLDPKKRNITIGTTLVVAVVLIVAIILLLMPQRSIAAYCKAYQEENTKLMSAKGNSYSVKVFSHSSSNPADFVAAFSRLEQVAPNDIAPDVKTLRQIFQKIDSDPSQAIGASLSGLSAESSVKAWTSSHCQN